MSQKRKGPAAEADGANGTSVDSSAARTRHRSTPGPIAHPEKSEERYSHIARIERLRPPPDAMWLVVVTEDGCDEEEHFVVPTRCLTSYGAFRTYARKNYGVEFPPMQAQAWRDVWLKPWNAWLERQKGGAS